MFSSPRREEAHRRSGRRLSKWRSEPRDGRSTAARGVRTGSVQDAYRMHTGKSALFRPCGCRPCIAIARREVDPVLTPSRCGKCTVLQLTAGLMIPGRGLVLELDYAVGALRDDRGIVFQQPTRCIGRMCMMTSSLPRRPSATASTRWITRAADTIAVVGLTGGFASACRAFGWDAAALGCRPRTISQPGQPVEGRAAFGG